MAPQRPSERAEAEATRLDPATEDAVSEEDAVVASVCTDAALDDDDDDEHLEMQPVPQWADVLPHLGRC